MEVKGLKLTQPAEEREHIHYKQQIQEIRILVY